jgi:hypothetical protein
VSRRATISFPFRVLQERDQAGVWLLRVGRVLRSAGRGCVLRSLSVPVSYTERGRNFEFRTF